jgi:uncharacterized protein
MKKVSLRFYEELNDFLPEERRKIRFDHEFRGSPSVKDLIESLGVPHTEVDLILMNGISVAFDYNIKDGDEISIYPVFESFEISEVQHLRPGPLRNPKFLLDVHLGSLAKYMRMAGFDTHYRNDFSDDEMVIISNREKRTILTKSRNLLKRNEVTHGYWVRSTGTEEQLREVVTRFHLEKIISPFTRCMECNHPIEIIDRNELQEKLPPKVGLWHNEFRICKKCGRIYWKGSHYQKMQSLIDKLKKSL